MIHNCKFPTKIEAQNLKRDLFHLFQNKILLLDKNDSVFLQKFCQLILSRLSAISVYVIILNLLFSLQHFSQIQSRRKTIFGKKYNNLIQILLFVLKWRSPEANWQEWRWKANRVFEVVKGRKKERTLIDSLLFILWELLAASQL